MYDVVQITGSLTILAPFALSIMGKIDQTSYGYLIANAVGSPVLR